MLGSLGTFVKGAIVGLKLMYFCDPQQGRRRRAALRDQAIRLGHDAENLWRRGIRDLIHRSAGLAASGRQLASPSTAADETIEARVRAKLGHLVEDARTVQVSVHRGIVTLRGNVRPGELEHLVGGLERISGVCCVESGLTVAGPPVSVKQRSTMAPGDKLLLTAGGAALLLHGLARRGFGPTLLGTAGFGMLIRGLADGRSLSSQRGVEVIKTIHIEAPIEKVFGLIANAEQTHRFLPNVRRSENLGGGRTRWTLTLPVGEVTFEDQLTDSQTNRRLAWESTPDAPVRYHGETLFEPDGKGTRVRVHLIYHPPVGMIGHAVAGVLGVDPKTKLDDSLARIKMYLEQGRAPHDTLAGANPA